MVNEYKDKMEKWFRNNQDKIEEICYDDNKLIMIIKNDHTLEANVKDNEIVILLENKKLSTKTD